MSRAPKVSREEREPMHIISLGAGVQSSTMALMAAAGEITPMWSVNRKLCEGWI